MSKISKERAAQIRADIAEREAEIRVLRGRLGRPLTVAEIRKLTPEEAAEHWDRIKETLPAGEDRRGRDDDERDRRPRRDDGPITAAGASAKLAAGLEQSARQRDEEQGR